MFDQFSLIFDFAGPDAVVDHPQLQALGVDWIFLVPAEDVVNGLCAVVGNAQGNKRRIAFKAPLALELGRRIILAQTGQIIKFKRVQRGCFQLLR